MRNKHKHKKLLIGVTGGIGSGKSLACEYLKKLGCSVFFADEIARKMYSTSAALRKKLGNEFGNRILDNGKKISFDKLRQIVFSSERNQIRVNNIVHPFVISEILRRVRNSPSNIIVIEAALIFESGFNRYLDFTILIHSSVKNRIERVRRRGKLTGSQIRSIIKLQMSEKEKMQKADVIINNDSTKRALQKQIECYYGFLRFME
jgi:dephospho-CoA kinase